jgi:DNA-binding Lrp family transcriptional regulator
MSARAYILLDTVHGKSEQVAQALRQIPGVVIVDRLEGRPDLLVLVEASDRPKLAELLMPVLSAMGCATEDLCLLVSRDSAAAPLLPACPGYPSWGRR